MTTTTPNSTASGRQNPQIHSSSFIRYTYYADRANAYYARSPHWTQEQMDQSAMLDLHKWQTGKDEFRVIGPTVKVSEQELETKR